MHRDEPEQIHVLAPTAEEHARALARIAELEEELRKAAHACTLLEEELREAEEQAKAWADAGVSVTANATKRIEELTRQLDAIHTRHGVEKQALRDQLSEALRDLAAARQQIEELMRQRDALMSDTSTLRESKAFLRKRYKAQRGRLIGIARRLLEERNEARDLVRAAWIAGPSDMYSLGLKDVIHAWNVAERPPEVPK